MASFGHDWLWIHLYERLPCLRRQRIEDRPVSGFQKDRVYNSETAGTRAYHSKGEMVGRSTNRVRLLGCFMFPASCKGRKHFCTLAKLAPFERRLFGQQGKPRKLPDDIALSLDGQVVRRLEKRRG